MENGKWQPLAYKEKKRTEKENRKWSRGGGDKKNLRRSPTNI